MSLSNIEFEDHELLSERTLEFGNIVELTPVTDNDRLTPWYRMIDMTTGPSTQWETREDYIARAYLPKAAKQLMFWAINSGSVKIYGTYPGKETLRMVPRIYFGVNRWEEKCVMSGRYHPMNTFQDGVDGRERESRSGYLLYIRDADWTQAIEVMLDRRRQLTGSVLDPRWRELGFGCAAHAGERKAIYALGLEPPAVLISPDVDECADAEVSWRLDKKIIPSVLPSDRTGAPGRPSAMHLIEQDLRNRALSGKMLPSITAETAELLKRYHSNPDYSALARTTRKTIENQLRAVYRELKRR